MMMRPFKRILILRPLLPLQTSAACADSCIVQFLLCMR